MVVLREWHLPVVPFALVSGAWGAKPLVSMGRLYNRHFAKNILSKAPVFGRGQKHRFPTKTSFLQPWRLSVTSGIWHEFLFPDFWELHEHHLAFVGAEKSTQTFFVQSFSTTLRVMDVRAENRGRPHQKVRFPAAPVVGRNFLTPGHLGVRVRNVPAKSGPKSLCLCCFFLPEFVANWEPGRRHDNPHHARPTSEKQLSRHPVAASHSIRYSRIFRHSLRGSLLRGGYNNSLHVSLAVPTPAPTPPPWPPFSSLAPQETTPYLPSPPPTQAPQ